MNRLQSQLGRISLAIVLVVGLGLTAACDTAEERAENHYQTGLQLLEEGEIDRALVEFRNVFKLNGEHEGARATYARVQRERGQSQEAYGQYLRLVEQYPDNLEGRRALAEMAVQARDWDEAERHVSKAIELDPDDVLIQSIDNAVNYFHAVRDKDEPAQEAAIIKAQALVEQDKGLTSAREILLDDLLRKQDWYAALDVIDEGLAADPANRELHRLRLGILQQTGDFDAVQKQLRDLMEQFPEERRDYKQALVRVFVAQGEIDEAEEFLREEARRDDAKTEDKALLIGFLEQVRGREAALEEVDNQIQAGGDDLARFRAMRAKLNFELGNTEIAIEEMEGLTKGAERNAETRAFEVDLARMLFRDKNAVGARALIEQVLAEDGSQPDAIKLKANWLIEDDETGDAIVMLRAALNQSPEDSELMALMAKAYEREGNKDLRVEMLSLAAQASGNAPADSMRYASALVADEKLVAAEGVLIDSLRLNPQNVALLSMLGNIYAQMEDWGRTESVIDALNKLQGPEAAAQAAALTTRKLAQQDRGEDLAAMLEGMTDDPTMGRNAEIALLRTRLANDGPEAANAYLDELLAESPDDPALRFIKAGFLTDLNKPDEAEAIFRDLISEDPNRSNVWIAYYRLKLQSGDIQGARDVLKESLKALPENATLLWAKAGELERDGDVEGAIAIYEDMYTRNSNSLVIANNLASLLATHRTDAESLQRAYTVSRRLRDSEVPAFQDTFGWILFRRGSHESALDYLTAAALGLPNDVTVQYHLAVNLAALARNKEALAQFNKVADMIDQANPPEFADEVAAEIARLGGAAPAND
ncbi:tetratricopeptide repeat protein [Sedimentitalea sp. JM2-8]|uniref:Tetratricopeptide repeat protein n=1 Tax=Sedimentitalea xiamensis TaxID=3050037 RepID=A0ABT7FI84_9RHOB|nr:tetratricopeptide repeat protein [Sedimentitalea xiamensis]MDK3074842.1 tetratricopeptide repeat protein [Sedimentitalea xiamensis]